MPSKDQHLITLNIIARDGISDTLEDISNNFDAYQKEMRERNEEERRQSDKTTKTIQENEEKQIKARDEKGRFIKKQDEAEKASYSKRVKLIQEEIKQGKKLSDANDEFFRKYLRDREAGSKAVEKETNDRIKAYTRSVKFQEKTTNDLIRDINRVVKEEEKATNELERIRKRDNDNRDKQVRNSIKIINQLEKEAADVHKEALKENEKFDIEVYERRIARAQDYLDVRRKMEGDYVRSIDESSDKARRREFLDIQRRTAVRPGKLEFPRDASVIEKVRISLDRFTKGSKDADYSARRLSNGLGKATASAGALSRRLGRLGLALRGLVIVGVLTFMHAAAAALGALGGAAVAAAGSLIYAAGALGGTFVAAASQAIPVIGLLVASFQRLGGIMQAVNQYDLLQKQQFGDQGAATKAADNTDQIADAQRGLKDAQEGVNEARKEAVNDLQDLIDKQKEAELAARAAILSQQDAKRAIREAVTSGDVEGIDSAQLGLDQSRFDTKQSLRNLRQARIDKRTGLAGGVEGTKRVKDAVDSLADAQRNLARAHKSAATAADTQSSAESSLEYFLSKLTDAERGLYEQILSFRKKLKEVFSPITDIIIRSFSYGIKKAEELLDNSSLISALKELATIVADSIKRVADVLTSPVFVNFFERTIGESAKNVPILTTGFITLLRIFKNIADGAAPALTELFKFLVGSLRSINRSFSDTESMNNFFTTGLEHFKAWYNLIGAIVGLIGELMGASSDSALEMISDLTDTINGAKDSLKADDSGAQTFFEQAAEGTKQVGRVLVALGDALVELTESSQIQSIADVIISILIPGLVEGVKLIGVFALIADKLAENPITSFFLKWGVAMSFAYAALVSIAGLFTPLVVFFREIFKFATADLVSRKGGFFNMIRGAPKSIGGFLTVIKELFISMRLFGMSLLENGRFIRIFSKGLAGIPVAGWIIAGVIELIIGMIAALKENFLGITDFVKDEFSQVTEVFEEAGEAFGELFNEISGSEEGFSGFIKVIGKALDILFKIVGVIGKLAAVAFIFTIFKTLVFPLKTFVKALTAVIHAITGIIKNIKRLVSGEISFKDFLLDMGKTFLNFFKDLFLAIGSEIFNGMKALGKIVWKGLTTALYGLGEGVGDFVIGKIITIVNWLIDKINAINPFGDIGAVGRGELEEATGGASKFNPAKRKDYVPGPTHGSATRGRQLDDETKAQKKKNKAVKEATEFTLKDFKAYGLQGKASKENIKLNNRFAGALNRSAKAHKRAKNLQEALNEAVAESTRKQNHYAASIKRVASAEERLGDALRKVKRNRFESAVMDAAATEGRNKLRSATRGVTSSQEKLTEETKGGSHAQGVYNKKIAGGTAAQILYEGSIKSTTKQTDLEAIAIRGLSKKLGILSGVLKSAGKNSRALGIVFRDVTNKLLTEFNVKKLNVRLPKVDSMFDNASNFATGGYFGRKGMQGPDDRVVKVAGGEAFLTAHQQTEADRAFSIANRVGGSPYSNLDDLFAKVRKPHREYARGGRAPGGRGSIVIPKSVPDAHGALPGLDLIAWLAKKYFGLGVSSGKDDHSVTTSSGNISDHSWGGAVDLSNSGSPSPQMDAAWHWFAKTLGGGDPGFVGSFTGGAIKQMIYRVSGVYGNHFDHVHIALQEAYAKNVELLTKILTGKAIPVATGGSIFAAAPQLKRPTIKGDKGAILKQLKGQAGVLTKGANKYLNRKIITSGPSNYSGAPATVAIDPGEKLRTGYTVYDDDPPGAFGQSLERGYAELGTADTSGLTGGGYLAQAFGLDGELPENYPLKVTINGKTRTLLKRDRGWGQGTNAYGIDIWRDSWPYFGLDANSSGSAIVTAVNRRRGKRERSHNLGGKVPKYHTGGVVPGPAGSESLALLRAGETVMPTFNDGGKNKKKGIRRFQGLSYDVTNLRDFILLLSDRINSFLGDIDEAVEEASRATAKWTYKFRKFRGKNIVSRANDAAREAGRELNDLGKEFKEIKQAINETNRARNRAKKKMNKVRNQYEKDIAKARKEGDEKEIENLKKARKVDLDRLRASLNNTNNKRIELIGRRSEVIASIYDAQIAKYEEQIGKFGDKIGKIDTRVEIATLQNLDDEGELTDAGKAQVKNLYDKRETVLEKERKRIQRELRQSRKIKDKERTSELEQALLDNQLALLQNTASIKELDKKVEENTDVFNFKTTNWELFRQAILNGSGGILPQFASTIPQLASGGYIQSDGIAYLHKGETVVSASRTSNGGPLVDTINFTQPMEVADPVTISNQIGFKLSTLKAT